MVLGIDKENKKVSLGIKQLSQDPWDTVEAEYPSQSIIDGEISKITNFGAFVRLPNGIEGLIHNTVLQDEHGKKAEELFKVGQQQQFRILNVNKKERKLALSSKLDAQSAPVEVAQPRPRRVERAPKREKAESSKVKGSLQMALEALGKKADDDSSDDKDKE